MTITTAEELDALPVGTLIQRLGPSGVKAAQRLTYGELWMFVGDDEMYSSEQMIGCGYTYAVLYNPDQPVSAAPTEGRIAEVVLREYHSRSAPSSSRAFAAHVAGHLAALYPTCQPSEDAERQIDLTPCPKCGGDRLRQNFDFDADAVREQMAQASRAGFVARRGSGKGYEDLDAERMAWWRASSAAALPIAVRAVTDAVRALHQPETIEVYEGYGAELWCPTCKQHTPCPTVCLCDEIDKAAGVQRDE